MYYIIQDPDDKVSTYCYYNSITDMWSSWHNTIKESLEVNLEDLGVKENGDSIEDACKENEFTILYSSEAPFNLEDHPELLL